MTQLREDLPRQAWHEFFELLTKEHDASTVTIEVVGLDLGDQVEAEHLPLAYLEYDLKDDNFVVGVGGRDGRYPVVFNHIVSRPRTILVNSPIPTELAAVGVRDTEGRETLIALHPLRQLP